MLFFYFVLVVECMFVVLTLASTTQFRVLYNRLLDEVGRESYFHGVNVVYKSPPYVPILDHFDANLSFSTEDMELLNSLGMNIIRLGVEWPGVMPEKNMVNTTYINKITNLISNAYSNYNIYTLVDSHQDVLSEALCGEGAPIWATKPNRWNFPEPLAKAYNVDDITHIPSREDCLSITWSSYYATEATGSAFEAIYKNEDGLRDSYANYWGVLASSFKDIDGIVGFELMNEPWAGNIYENPFLMLPGEADKRNLQPFYDAIVPTIYGNDSNRVVFFESVTWTDEFNISITETGFDHVPGGSKYSETSVFAFHYYVPPNEGPIDDYFYERTHDAIKWNSTSFLTEFSIGSIDPMDMCDQYLISWIAWEYKPFAGALPDGTCTGCGYGLWTKDGKLNTDIAKSVSRTYAMKVSGKTQTMKFDNNNGNFSIVYNIDTDLSEYPTVIYWSNYWYPNGYILDYPKNQIVNVTNNGANYIYLYHTDNSADNGAVITISLTPKS